MAENNNKTADQLSKQIDSIIADGPKTATKPGPKPVAIPWGIVRNMAAYFCPIKDICAGLDMSYETVNNRCKEENGMTLGEYLSSGEGKGRNEIRKHQMLLLQRGNAAMAKWMGMQHLGQAPVVKITHRVSQPGDAPPEPPTGFAFEEVSEDGTIIGEVLSSAPAPNAEVSNGPAQGPNDTNPKPA